ncbi:MAG: UvrD-helicase domain-containing protein [Halieaceae bacterium]|nr:UvrD-helicase domain-containing protein [Halieaceae bacterium]
MKIVDASQRSRAIDPLASYCVSAPAGSGKTELLIQRFLALLARVERPEQVLAITFTRKAAAEMRERVLAALVDALRDVPCSGEHQHQTRRLALAALELDKRFKWQLTDNIARLNIKTIDSFCAVLTRQMPVLSEFGGQVSVTDDTVDLYAEAVLGLFQMLDSNHPVADDLAALMLHFDNDWNRLHALLLEMLPRRDQWRDYIGVHKQAEEAESYLRRAVRNIVLDALASLNAKLNPYTEEILDLQRYAAANLKQPVPTGFPSVEVEDLSRWRSVRQLLLTADKKGKWRARADKRMGFPPGAGEPQRRKDQLKELVAQLLEIDELLAELAGLTLLPEMDSQSESWALVLHLSRILPLLAAQLLLVFQRHGKVDHCQVALSALQALGDDEAPTELALRLDYQMQHILVDEFQDTAINQFELVRRLTRGWGQHNAQNPQQPRTILIVGDGMQSIYGFRDANVGLFLRAAQEGFNGVALTPLTLRTNFRSDQGIVHWVNRSFASAFPAHGDASQGQVSFTPATAVRPEVLTPAVELHGFYGEAARAGEIEFICDWAQQGAKDASCQSIAILGRTRTQLQAILGKLRQQNIAYSAQGIDSLANATTALDLLSLCRALANPADRVAWMAILRAPWCGLSLSDLHLIATFEGPNGYPPVGAVLGEQELVEQLSSDGQARVAHLFFAIEQARRTRDRLALRVWVEQLWLSLGGPATIMEPSGLEDAERFFQLLEKAEMEGVGLRPDWLLNRLNKLYVDSGDPHSKIQIMTLHKAKGLEFDWVIIPQTDRLPRANTRQLLLWDEHTNASGQRSFLLAVDDSSINEGPTLYNWLQAQQVRKGLAETTRLLYVGATRAVQRLLVTAGLNFEPSRADFKPPSDRSLLGSIWPVFSDQMSSHEVLLDQDGSDLQATGRNLRRIHRSLLTVTDSVKAEPTAANSPVRAGNRIERYTGTVVHLALEGLAEREELPDCSSASDHRLWTFELRRLGLDGPSLHRALTGVVDSVNHVLADPDGRWILSSSHREAHSEWPLSCVQKNGRLADIIVDRTFIDVETGTRWLVDYKNSKPNVAETLAEFLSREEASYSDQLERYRLALSHIGPQPVQAALYFTTLGYLHRVGGQTTSTDR